MPNKKPLPPPHYCPVRHLSFTPADIEKYSVPSKCYMGNKDNKLCNQTGELCDVLVSLNLSQNSPQINTEKLQQKSDLEMYLRTGVRCG